MTSFLGHLVRRFVRFGSNIGAVYPSMQPVYIVDKWISIG